MVRFIDLTTEHRICGLSVTIAAYVLVAIVKKRLNLSLSLYGILQILSVTLFEKTPILQLFSEDHAAENDSNNPKQLFLLE